MPCARDENKMVAAHLFQNICPQGYSVDEVYPFNSKTKPYCRWLVKFIKDNEEQFPLPGKDLKRIYDKLTRFNPSLNAKVLSKHNGGRFAAFVTYAVLCDCTESQNFEIASNQMAYGKKRGGGVCHGFIDVSII